MKKLSILLVLAIFCLSTTSTFAQDTKEVAKKEMKAKKKDYAEVATADLPEAVQATLKESFADYNVKKAYKAKNEEGKLVYYAKVEKDGKWLKVGLDESGKIFKKKELHKKHKKEKSSK